MFLNFPFWTRCLFALLLVVPLQAVSAADLLDRQVLAGLAGDSISVPLSVDPRDSVLSAAAAGVGAADVGE